MTHTANQQTRFLGSELELEIVENQKTQRVEAGHSAHNDQQAQAASLSATTALFQVIPVPFEATVSYGKGTSQGPAAILEASDQLELWDGESVPADLGIHTWPSVDCQGSTQQVLLRIEQRVTQALNAGGQKRTPIPVVLGGEHTVTYGALKALVQHFGSFGSPGSFDPHGSFNPHVSFDLHGSFDPHVPFSPFGVVQFDAHADLRDTYEDTPWSHASVMRRAVKDLGLPLVQLGVRALCLEEVQARQSHHVAFHDAPILARTPFEGLKDLPLLPHDFPSRIYVSFDVDGLDPSVIAATGTPVPGGLDWYKALELARLVMTGRQVLGFDVVELAPAPGFHASDFAAARLVYALMGLVQRTR